MSPGTREPSRTRVYLLRHGESANPRVFHGSESDIDLSDRGRLQAARIATLFPALRPSAVVSSAMLRARETAAPIAAACGLPLRIERALHERSIGPMSGSPHEEFEGDWQMTRRSWQAGETSFAPPGTESFDQIRARVLPVWNGLAHEYQGHSIVIVAHGVVCKVLLVSVVNGWTVADWSKPGPIQNVAISELVQAGKGWEPVRINELPTVIRDLG